MPKSAAMVASVSAESQSSPSTRARDRQSNDDRTGWPHSPASAADPGEVTDWRLAAPAEWDILLAGHMARRLYACSRALAEGSTLYLQHGFDPARCQA
jgi:hypothetical protein